MDEVLLVLLKVKVVVVAVVSASTFLSCEVGTLAHAGLATLLVA